MKNMNTPRTRAEFERNFHLIASAMKEGRYHVSADCVRSLDGLSKVRNLPNGRIDFLSVDESARLNANSMNQFTEESLQDFIKETEQSSQEKDLKDQTKLDQTDNSD